MDHHAEKDFLDRTLGPGFYRLVQDYRQRQTDSIHAWLRDAVLTTLHDPHAASCDCPLHDLGDVQPYDLAAALTMTVRDVVNEAAASGVDAVQLMRRHSSEQLGRRALSHRSFGHYLQDTGSRSTVGGR